MENIINYKVIEEYLKYNNMTRKEFCAMCKMSPTTFSKIVCGENVRMDTIFKVAKKINCHIRELLL